MYFYDLSILNKPIYIINLKIIFIFSTVLCLFIFVKIIASYDKI